MTPVEVIIDVLIGSAPFLFVWRSPPDRTWRNAARLLLIAGLFVLVRVAVADPLRFVLSTAMACTFGVVVLRFPFLLVGLSITDARVDGALRRILDGVNPELERWLREPDDNNTAEAKEGTLRACVQALAELDALPTTNARWRRTIDLVRESLVLLRQASLPEGPARASLGVSERSGLLRDEIDREWNVALGRRRP